MFENFTSQKTSMASKAIFLLATFMVLILIGRHATQKTIFGKLPLKSPSNVSGTKNDFENVKLY